MRRMLWQCMHRVVGRVVVEQPSRSKQERDSDPQVEANSPDAREELCKHLGVLPQRRNEYESASQTLEFMAMRVKSLEQEKADINAADDDEDSMLGQELGARLGCRASGAWQECDR